MTEAPEKLYFNLIVGLPTTHKLVESDIEYIRSDIVEKMLTEQREACADAIAADHEENLVFSTCEEKRAICLNATQQEKSYE